MEKMPNPNQMVLKLRPLEGGAYTQVSLHGPVCSDPQTRWVRYLLKTFSYWNGWPVRVVLSVTGLKAPWLNVWCDVLATVPASHHEVEFRVAPASETRRDAR
jgi:hypothetical protein